MTKKEITEKLDEAGIEYAATAKKVELMALLPKQTVDEKSYELELRAYDKYDVLKETFSRTRQGKNFKALAEQFARNKGYTLR